MKHFDESRQAGEALCQCTSRLCAAILRISASLELDIVLREIVENARELTGARYGVITTIGETGKAADFVMSGFSEDERQQLLAWSEGLRLFEHFRELSGILRLTDLPTYISARGFSADLVPSGAFQATPIRHQGRQVGLFFLSSKQQGREFTSEDEEILMIFASQAAIVIGNAHAHRNERRARADLEALIDTSPVGVVVFDTRTGNPELFNQEAQRLINGIQVPGYTEEQLLGIITCRRSDGRETTFAELVTTLDSGNFEAVRAETVELSVGDDRRIKILVNATAIHSPNGTIDSLIVTMQDLAPLEEFERSRTEFLGMVSHELRAPLTSIKGSSAAVLGNSETLGRDEMLQFFRIVNEQADHMQSLISDLLDAGRIGTGTLSVFPEPWNVFDLVERARTLFLSGGSQHAVRINLQPELPRIMVDSHRIVQVLNNLFSNAAKNSSSRFPIVVTAVQDDMHVAISVSDEGKGVSPELLPHLFEKYVGFQKNSEHGIRGFGLGLAICKGLVETHGGRIWAESAGVGMGARFTFTVPVAEKSIVGGQNIWRRNTKEVSKSTANRTRILVVDDDLRMLRYVQDILTSAGYSPIVSSDHRELSRIIKEKRPGLVLLDLVLLGIDGITLMENVRELADQPVIFLSGYGRDQTIARALESGAVDYIVNPFSPTELTARIKAALRRSAEPGSCVLKDLEIHYDRRLVTVTGRTIHLTSTEYRLLRLLSLNAGSVVTYDKLISLLWGDEGANNKGHVRTFVKKLRHKLGDNAAEPTYILNVHGVGYKTCAPDGVARQ